MIRLKELRLKKGLTLKKVASDNGLAESQLSFYETGKRKPRNSATWEKLADYFNVSVSYLMGLSDEKIDEKEALNVAKQIFFSYLTNYELDDEERTAVQYFNNEELDNVLLKAMKQYFTIPFVQETPEMKNLEKKYFLRSWLCSYLLGRYQKEVKNNHNFIANTYDSIPSNDEINTYNLLLSDENQLPLDDALKKILTFDNLPAEIYKDLEKIKDSDATLIAYEYESSVDERLKEDINKILDTARSDILGLKEKYPNKPSKLELATILVTKDEDFPFWSHIGTSDFKDEMNLSEETKKLLIKTTANIIERNKNQAKE